MRPRIGLPTSNPVTALLLVQLLIVVGGYLLTRGSIHQAHRVWGDMLSAGAISWARLVARFGLCMLIIPGVWGGWILLSVPVGAGASSISRGRLVTGCFFTLLLLACFALAVLQATCVAWSW